MGKHVDTLTVQQRVDARFYYLVSVWPALLAITVPKVAVAGLIIRIFTPDIWTKTIMSAVVCVGVVNYIVISALSTFQCQPLAASWDPRVRAAECVSAKIYLDLCYFTSCRPTLRVPYGPCHCPVSGPNVYMPSLLCLCRLLPGHISGSRLQEDGVQHNQEDKFESCPRPRNWSHRSGLPQDLIPPRPLKRGFHM